MCPTSSVMAAGARLPAMPHVLCQRNSRGRPWSFGDSRRQVGVSSLQACWRDPDESHKLKSKVLPVVPERSRWSWAGLLFVRSWAQSRRGDGPLGEVSGQRTLGARGETVCVSHRHPETGQVIVALLFKGDI